MLRKDKNLFVFEGNIVKMKLNGKIANKLNLWVVLDISNYELVRHFSWTTTKRGVKKTFYARTSIYKMKDGKKSVCKTLLMHRLIMWNVSNLNIVDHIDLDGLNNRKSNLRNCNMFESARNKSKFQNCLSRYKGVTPRNGLRKKTWRARIHYKKPINIGDYNSELDAAIAYDIKAKELFGEFANLNFKDTDYSKIIPPKPVLKDGVYFRKDMNAWSFFYKNNFGGV